MLPAQFCCLNRIANRKISTFVDYFIVTSEVVLLQRMQTPQGSGSQEITIVHDPGRPLALLTPSPKELWQKFSNVLIQ